MHYNSISKTGDVIGGGVLASIFLWRLRKMD